MDAAAAAASMTLDRSLRIDSFLEVEVSGGTTGDGTVTLTGTDPSGAAQVETLTFSSNGIQQTVNRWEAGTSPSVTTTGLSDEASVPTVAIEAIDASGQPQLQRVVAAAARPVIIGPIISGAWPAGTSGTHERGRANFLLDFEEVWTPDVGYIATDDFTGDTWTVDLVEEIRLGYGYRVNHWRLQCRKLDT